MTLPVPVSGFDRWWAAWPRSSRKGGKSQCEKKWKQEKYEAKADEIVRHTEYMKGTVSWQQNSGEFIPMPMTYLNQMRWDGADIPEVVDAHAQTQVLIQELTNRPATPMPANLREKLRGQNVTSIINSTIKRAA